MHKYGFVVSLIVVAIIGCGKSDSAPETQKAEMAIGATKTGLTQSVTCEYNLSGAITDGLGKSENNRIELKNSSGYSLVVVLAPFAYGESRTYSTVIEQGEAKSNITFNTPSGSYSTALSKTASPEGRCTVTLQSYSKFQISCTNIAGTNNDKASMTVGGTCRN